MSGCIAYVSDLIFATKIASTAGSIGRSVLTVHTAEAFFERATANQPELVIIDLNAAGDPLAAVQAARKLHRPPRTIAFASHVQTDLIEKARAAGADEVMARSTFAARLAQLLQEVG